MNQPWNLMPATKGTKFGLKSEQLNYLIEGEGEFQFSKKIRCSIISVQSNTASLNC
jgi:hypothetical protein